jgi:YidC/Oxa1 family membrane protein insertase
MLSEISMFDPFFTFFASILAWFYALTGNYALAIIMLTLCVMIIVTPLTLKGTRSMMMMQQLQPEMRKIQARYKDDRQKQNEELLKFYKENNINPLGGCLPLLVQMPVFLVLYQVLRGVTRRVSDLGANVGWSAGQSANAISPLTNPPSIVRVFDPAWIKHSTEMYQNLSVSTSMEAFGMDLSESASKAIKSGAGHAAPFIVLIAIVAVTGFLQQRQIQGRNPNAQVNPQQQMIMKIMPIFLPVISFGLPAGLVLYFAVSNMYRIGQQAFISHSIYGGKENGMTWKDMFGLSRGAAAATKPKPKSSTKGKGKAIPASSRPKTGSRAKTPAKTASKAPAKAAAGGGAQAKKGTSTPATKAGGQPRSRRGAAAASTEARPETSSSSPAEEPASSAATAPRDDGGTSPDTTSTPTPAGNGGTPTLQPRARRKKR